MSNQNRSCCAGVLAYIVAILGVFLIGYGLVWLLRHYTQPAPVDAARGAERLKARTELATAAQEQLGNYGYIDAAKGQVRLPVDKAMELVVQEWKNPSEGRAKLLERWKKANPPPPPKAPEKPSEFE